MMHRESWRSLFPLIMAVVLVMIVSLPVSATASQRQARDDPPVASPDSNQGLADTSRQYFPYAARAEALRQYFPYVAHAQTPPYRIGYTVVDADLSRYPTVNQLNAGWYLNWSVIVSPLRPSAIEFVQTVRVHQKLTCPSSDPNAWDRSVCPYAVPYDYVIQPSWTELARAVRAMPGSFWIIGNEMDRRDWYVPNPAPHTEGQDEILPETYAVAYHDIYSLIKSVDPTATVGIGGVIQATPLRLEYLTKAWNSYITNYGTPMPVDVFNVHDFILKEKRYYPGCGDCYGADIPPGSNASVGVTYASDTSHVNMTIFGNQIRAFRQWMKDRGQQNKPLIVSEYGVLYSHAGLDDQAVVENFMLNTFDYMLNTNDCNLGYPQDACRLVQRWAWYSLDDDGIWTSSYFNEYGALYKRDTAQITATGVKYRDWVAAHRNELN